MNRETAERLASVVVQRHSTRKFGDTAIDSETMGSLVEASRSLEAFDGVSIRVEFVEGARARSLFRGLIGSYGKITGCPAVAVFIVDARRPGCLEAVGYCGEQMILEATSLGLDTCWVSGFFKRSVARALVSPGEGESVIAVTPLGHTTGRLGRIHDESMELLTAMFGRRKPLEAITDTSLKHLPRWLGSALEAARLAPSAVNRQPWVFEVRSDGSVAIFVNLPSQGPHVKMIDSRRLDCGIAMLHFRVTALAHGVDGAWNLCPEDSGPIAVLTTAIG